jgi:hypothetical protein
VLDMDYGSSPIIFSKTSLLSVLESSTWPPGTSSEVSDDVGPNEDVTYAAQALCSFLNVAFRAKLIPRSIHRLSASSMVDRLGEGADYRVVLFSLRTRNPSL